MSDEVSQKVRDIVISTLSRAGADMAQVGIDQIVIEACDQLLSEMGQTWEESAEATADWMSNNPGPTGIPHDPPSNPYDAPEPVAVAVDNDCTAVGFTGGGRCIEPAITDGLCVRHAMSLPTFQTVLAHCDCWSEASLRAAPIYATRPKNHDPMCPVYDLIKYAEEA